jgi:hypothetical protein
VAVHSKARVEAAACSEAEDVAVVGSETGIEDGRWQWHRR